MLHVNKMAQDTATTKLKKVDNEVKKRDFIFENKEILKTVEKIAKEISNQLVNVSVRKAVQVSEVQKKYPPLPAKLQNLSEPSKAAYIALYNKHRDVLNPKTVNCIKEKIAEHLKTIEERTNRDQLVKEKQLDRRKKRKLKATKEYKSTEYTQFSFEQCDEIFEMFLDKFSKSHNRGIPKPLIMGPNSRSLHQKINGKIMELVSISPSTDKAMEAVEKVVQTEEAVKPKIAAEATETTDETTETLTYFIMEFIKNSLVEAAKIAKK